MDMLGEHFPQFLSSVDLLFPNLGQDLNLKHLTQMSQCSVMMNCQNSDSKSLEVFSVI